MYIYRDKYLILTDFVELSDIPHPHIFSTPNLAKLSQRIHPFHED